MNKIKNYLTLAATSILMAPVNIAHATSFQFDPDVDTSGVDGVITTIKPILSLVLKVGSWGIAIASVVFSVFNFIGYFREENAGKAQEKKSLGIKSLIAAGIAFAAMPIINLILDLIKI